MSSANTDQRPQTGKSESQKSRKQAPPQREVDLTPLLKKVVKVIENVVRAITKEPPPPPPPDPEELEQLRQQQGRRPAPRQRSAGRLHTRSRNPSRVNHYQVREFQNEADYQAQRTLDAQQQEAPTHAPDVSEASTPTPRVNRRNYAACGWNDVATGESLTGAWKNTKELPGVPEGSEEVVQEVTRTGALSGYFVKDAGSPETAKKGMTVDIDGDPVTIPIQKGTQLFSTVDARDGQGPKVAGTMTFTSDEGDYVATVAGSDRELHGRLEDFGSKGAEQSQQGPEHGPEHGPEREGDPTPADNTTIVEVGHDPDSGLHVAAMGCNQVQAGPGVDPDRTTHMGKGTDMHGLGRDATPAPSMGGQGLGQGVERDTGRFLEMDLRRPKSE